MGMNVFFYDTLQIMPLGTSTPLESLDLLLQTVDFVTLHVLSFTILGVIKRFLKLPKL